MKDFTLRIHSELGAAEIHLDSFESLTVKDYREMLVHLRVVKDMLRNLGIENLVTYARHKKFLKLFSLMGFENGFMCDDDGETIYIGRMVI